MTHERFIELPQSLLDLADKLKKPKPLRGNCGSVAGEGNTCTNISGYQNGTNIGHGVLGGKMKPYGDCGGDVIKRAFQKWKEMWESENEATLHDPHECELAFFAGVCAANEEKLNDQPAFYGTNQVYSRLRPFLGVHAQAVPGAGGEVQVEWHEADYTMEVWIESKERE